MTSTGPRLRRIRTLEEGVYPNAGVSYISVDWENCKACTGRLGKGELPACVEACPTPGGSRTAERTKTKIFAGFERWNYGCSNSDIFQHC
ncbi:MAG: hypothetical protein JW821_14775 [Deltaproteobacteria bacterium]|nr:hypothetical protein [Deltaproteobacteria bacterium]